MRAEPSAAQRHELPLHAASCWWQDVENARQSRRGSSLWHGREPDRRCPDGFRAVPGHDGGSPHRGDWLDEVTIAARWFGHDGAYPSYDFINGLGRRRISHQNGEFITTQTEYETRRGSFG
jgi:hypothetical protein